jgi:hypothetical protein
MYVDASIVDRGKDDYPVSPFVQMVLLEHSSSDDGHICIGPDLMTDSGIDEFVNKLLGDIERFRTIAKAAVKTRSAPQH